VRGADGRRPVRRDAGGGGAGGHAAGQATVVTTLAWAAHDAAQVRAPAVVVIGEVVGERVQA
jgi:siroheme synthase